MSLSLSLSQTHSDCASFKFSFKFASICKRHFNSSSILDKPPVDDESGGEMYERPVGSCNNTPHVAAIVWRIHNGGHTHTDRQQVSEQVSGFT